MKKLLYVIAVLLCFCLSTTVFAADENVEISFRVGESTLRINGTETPVETPYVVGDGVTLVPVRVITEAFGAKVDWIESTETVTLEYPGVNIVLQIGNSVAEVNGKAETLLAAPELSQAGYTMVPLRFISENFGAEVSYDDKTEAIKVVKKASSQNSSTVVGSVDSDYIGDSYFGWTIENPKDMVMDNRSFDGLITEFSYGDNNSFYILHSLLEEDFDFEKDFSNKKSSLSDYTLVKAEKNTDSDIKTAHLQAKNKDKFFNAQYYVTDNYLVSLVGVFDNTDAEKRDEFIRIMSTFTPEFDSSKAHDLSNAIDGWRSFEDDFTGLSIKIPEEYCQITRNSQNEFDFVSNTKKDTFSTIHVRMYSKSEVGTASSLASNDYQHNKLVTNSSIASFTPVVPTKYNGIEVYEYTRTVSGSHNNDSFSKDIFFEKGDYVYNLCVTIKEPSDRKEIILSKVLSSIAVKEVDSSEVGIIMRNEPDTDTTFSAKINDWSVTLPNSYEELSSSNNNNTLYYENGSGIMISTLIDDPLPELKGQTIPIIRELVSKMLKQNNSSIVDAANTRRISGDYYAVATTRIDSKTRTYTRYYATIKSKKLLVFAVSIPEITYSDYHIERVEKIITSFTRE